MQPTTATVLRLVTKPRKTPRRKGAGEWRSIARSWRIKDGRHVIVSVPLDGLGDDGKRFTGEAYWHREAGAWWLANTAPGDRNSMSVEDVFGRVPDLWHPMPSEPVEKSKKQAVSRKVKKASKCVQH